MSSQQQQQFLSNPNFDPVVDIIHDKQQKQHQNVNPNIWFGIKLASSSDMSLEQALAEGTQSHVDFVVMPLCKQQQQQLITLPLTAKQNISKTNYLLRTTDWNQRIVGMLNEHLFTFDVSNLQEQQKAEMIFRQEVEWAQYLSLPALLIPLYRCCKKRQVFLARILANLIGKTNLQFWLQVPAYSESHEDDSYVTFAKFKSMCANHGNIFPVLLLNADLPELDSALDRWFGEQLKAIVLHQDCFMSDAGYPVLSLRHEQFCCRAFAYDMQFIFDSFSDSMMCQLVVNYLLNLYNGMPVLTDVQNFEKPYWDYLQVPLQPLLDNLESQTYEVFERDPVKYALYEDAIRKALLDRSAVHVNRVQVVMVVGAGRGPLVKAAIRASLKADKKIKLFAVEKNPHALVILNHWKNTIWQNEDVTIIHSDMRDWQPSEKADILVSELLGSFGDNELSPECLDGAQRLLRDDGVSIPTSYTSFIAPICASKFYNDARSFGDMKHMETGYVVKIHRGYSLAQPLKCFEFVHPNPQVKSSSTTVAPIGILDALPIPHDNYRYTCLNFVANETATIHGLIGYFECVLYKDVLMSIHPDTHSKGMFSWFPIAFPLHVPVLVNKGQNIQVHFWRNTQRNKVWYEWCLQEPTCTSIHNVQGRSQWIEK